MTAQTFLATAQKHFGLLPKMGRLQSLGGKAKKAWDVPHLQQDPITEDKFTRQRLYLVISCIGV